MNICLERAYGLIGQDDSGITINKIKNSHLKNAVIFIESHYPESITLYTVLSLKAKVKILVVM